MELDSSLKGVAAKQRVHLGLKLCCKVSFWVTTPGEMLTPPFIAGRITMAMTFLRAG